MITAAVSPPEQMMADRGPRVAAGRRSGVADQRPRTGAAGARLAVAIGLGLVSIAGSVVLVAADGIGGGVRWSHHAGASAAPLLLVAGAIAAVTVAHPVKTRRALMRVLAVLAFTAWGVRGHEKVPVCGQVEVLASGQLKVPVPRSSCRPGV